MALDSAPPQPNRRVGLSTDTKPTQGVEPFDEFIESDTGNEAKYTGSSWTDTVTGGAAHSFEQGLIAGERNPDSVSGFLAAVPECNYASVTADTDISSSAPGLLLGVLVTAATATNVIEIRDANAAGAGTVVLSIPASTAIGTFYDLKGAKLNTGIYADFTGTGTIVVLWRAQ